MKIEIRKITELKENPDNPRIIRDAKFKKLVKSIQEFPKMLEIRPIIIDENNIILGGNQRYKACKEAGFTEVSIIDVSSLTEKEKKEFIIKDNSNFGDWDWDLVMDKWEEEELTDWGVIMPNWNDDLTNHETYEGLDRLSKLDKFMNAEVKRMFLVYDNETFNRVISWFNRLQKKYDVEGNNEVILKLMENENI